MKATKAYIASLGTTGVLLAASILMLAVVSAVVAFDRWPDGHVSTRVQTLALSENAAPIRVTARPLGASARPIVARAAVGGTQRPGGPRVAGERFTGGRLAPIPTALPVHAGLPTAPSLPKPPQLPDAQTLPDLISNPGTTAGQVADGAQSVTDAAGVSVGKVNPSLGNAVSGAGQVVAQTIRQLPLPQHLVPGH